MGGESIMKDLLGELLGLSLLSESMPLEKRDEVAGMARLSSSTRDDEE